MERYITNSAEETERLGAAFGAALTPGDVVAFSGGLGAGKTVFVRGVAAALGCTAEVRSPTFALVHEYGGTPPLYHFDVYRLPEAEAEAFGWIDDYLFGDGVCLIEWAERIADLLPPHWLVEIKMLPRRGADCREIRISRPAEGTPDAERAHPLSDRETEGL